ncbi:hypothetical protein, partial [Mammaliicoccus sciuri]|uniref:hypothetical protein n=1 Tax=Mammaliicoccus sciuri TaxID=1296 RepID=UPI0031FE738F
GCQGSKNSGSGGRNECSIHLNPPRDDEANWRGKDWHIIILLQPSISLLAEKSVNPSENHGFREQRFTL